MQRDSRQSPERQDPRVDNLLSHMREDICGELLAINDYYTHAREAELLGLDKAAMLLRQIMASEKEHLAHHIRLLIETDAEQADVLARVFGASPIGPASGPRVRPSDEG